MLYQNLRAYGWEKFILKTGGGITWQKYFAIEWLIRPAKTKKISIEKDLIEFRFGNWLIGPPKRKKDFGEKDFQASNWLIGTPGSEV